VDQRQTGSGLGGESKTGGPKTNWQCTWGRVKDRWTKDKLAVDLGESQRQVDQRQTGSELAGKVKDKLAVDLGESQGQMDQRQTGSGIGGESKTGGPKTKRQLTCGRVKYKLART
jgi:hypothetical protein